jgi:hypothetical protein
MVAIASYTVVMKCHITAYLTIGDHRDRILTLEVL